MKIPWSPGGREWRRVQAEVSVAIERVLSSGSYILGEDVTAFEEEFGSYCGVKYAISVNSGSDAIFLALLSLGIGKGDEVVVPANACWSIANAVLHSGAHPRLVDIDERTYNIDVGLLEKTVTPKTKAILAVHSYGQPCDIEGIRCVARKHGLRVIEDISVAPGTTIDGRRVGGFGDCAVVSFGPGKILTAFGSGGMVLTNDSGIAKDIRVKARYGLAKVEPTGITPKYLPLNGELCICEAWNSHLDSIQAAVLRVKLRHLDHWLQERAMVAQLYKNKLSSLDVVLPYIRPGFTSAYRGFAIRVKNRNCVLQALRTEGIDARTLYLPPLHLQPFMKRFGYREGNFPVTERIASELIVLPLYPELTSEEIEHVVNVIEYALQLSKVQHPRTKVRP